MSCNPVVAQSLELIPAFTSHPVIIPNQWLFLWSERLYDNSSHYVEGRMWSFVWSVTARVPPGCYSRFVRVFLKAV